MNIDAAEWAVKAEQLEQREILTSMDCDGTKADIELTREVAF